MDASAVVVVDDEYVASGVDDVDDGVMAVAVARVRRRRPKTPRMSRSWWRGGSGGS